MGSLPISAITKACNVMINEAFAGPPDPNSTWFIDNEPDSGILGNISKLSAAEASQSVDGSGKSGSTIASNVEHLRWSMAFFNAELRGEPYSHNWSESWQWNSTDEAAWNRLRSDLRAEFEKARSAVQEIQDLPEPLLLSLLATVAHCAFHLGLIRQMIERVNA